jgi:hypothetical protein
MLKGVTGSSQGGTVLDRLRSADRGIGRRRLYGAVGSGIVLAGAVGYVGLVDPHRPDSMFPVCPFRLLTGWNCPLCGAFRMTHDVLHGDVVAAITDNVFLLAGIPMLAGWLLVRRRGEKALLTVPVAVSVVIVTLVWAVVRNLPGFPLVPAGLAG